MYWDSFLAHKGLSVIFIVSRQRVTGPPSNLNEGEYSPVIS